MNLRKIKVDNIIAPSFATICSAPLLVSMNRNGLKIPITVRKIARTGWLWFFTPQYYELIDGQARLDCARRLGWWKIPAQIVTLSDANLLEASIIASTPYVPTPPAVYRKALLRILEINPDLTRDELATRINWTRERLDRTLDTCQPSETHSNTSSSTGTFTEQSKN